MTDAIDHTSVERFLRKLPILKGLSDRHVGIILQDFAIRSAPKDEVIFHQSDNSTDLYIIVKGNVKASLINIEGDELILATFSEGDHFGELSLFDGKPRSATITTSEASVFGILTREKFLQAVRNDPMIAIDLISSLAHRMRMADEKIESLAFLDVSQRLVKLLVDNAKGEKDCAGCYRVKKLTHREMAAHTGSSREAISKALKVLSFKGLIREEEGHFLISPEVGFLL
jgi:CRP-like cAMP-binding protein